MVKYYERAVREAESYLSGPCWEMQEKRLTPGEVPSSAAITSDRKRGLDNPTHKMREGERSSASRL